MKQHILIPILVIFLAIFGYIYFFYNHSSQNSTKATSTNTTISSQGDWEAGERLNIDSATTSGSIKMDTKAPIHQELAGAVATSENTLGTASDLLNGACGEDTLIFQGGENPVVKSLTVDLGEIKTAVFFQVTFINACGELVYSTSANGTDWSEVSTSDVGSLACSGASKQSSVFTGRYVKIVSPELCASSRWGSFDLFAQASTHKATIDGGENFWSWDANTIAQTVPANTTATYQYRTSANGTDWTSWVEGIGSVTSRTGDDSNNPTRYRYLQIKATLTNTDGTSTPTIDSYTIDYHTEVKPGTPSAQTAVVQ